MQVPSATTLSPSLCVFSCNISMAYVYLMIFTTLSCFKFNWITWHLLFSKNAWYATSLCSICLLFRSTRKIGKNKQHERPIQWMMLGIKSTRIFIPNINVCSIWTYGTIWMSMSILLNIKMFTELHKELKHFRNAQEIVKACLWFLSTWKLSKLCVMWISSKQTRDRTGVIIL